METVASKFAWIPEDDLLLKNAIEDGASLEALAKGAVRFSRKFTFRELQDRWHSLLYDPYISAEASARMVEFEHSVSSYAPRVYRFGSARGIGEVSAKRKVDSIRRKYYAMRKRIRGQPFDANGSFSQLSCAPNLNRCNGNADGGDYQDHMLINKVVPSSSLHGGHILSNCRLQETDSEDIRASKTLPVTDLPETDNLEVKTFSNSEFIYNGPGNVFPGYGEQQPFDSPVSHKDTPLHSIGFSDCLLNLANDSHLLFMDEDANNKMDTYDNLNSLLLSSPNQSHEECLPDDSEPEPKAKVSGTCLATSLLLSSPNQNHEEGLPDDSEPTPKANISDTCLAITGGASPARLDVIDCPAQTAHDIQHSDINVPSSSSVPEPHNIEFHDDTMPCSLNTEDPEVPCNDDIFPLGELATAVTQSDLEKVESQKDNLHEICLKQENPEQSLMETQRLRLNKFPETGPNHTLVGHSVQDKFSSGVCLDGASRHAKSVYSELGQHKSVHNALASAMKGELLESDSLATIADCPTFYEESDLVGMAFPEPALNPSTSDQEVYESDDNLPCFSDVEALILEMDLCACDQESVVTTEVSRYQNDNAKKTIMRLEQCAHSSLQRGMASQGALAIFYGRHLKHYIRKTEVILGRATDDMDVDIDLGKEGRANKISRRQASIKMGRDGSFFLKNLGKISISVNGKEIATGQLSNLNSSCLIEIREMRFVFEVNHKSVRQYLINVEKKSKQKNATFKWSPEGFP